MSHWFRSLTSTHQYSHLNSFLEYTAIHSPALFPRVNSLPWVYLFPVHILTRSLLLAVNPLILTCPLNILLENGFSNAAQKKDTAELYKNKWTIVQDDNNIAFGNHLTGWWFAFKVCGLGLVSDAWSFAKAARASGKFGGVAGVFAGVTSWKEKWNDINNDETKDIARKLIQNKLSRNLPRYVGNVKGSLHLEKTNSKRSRKTKRNVECSTSKMKDYRNTSKYDRQAASTSRSNQNIN